ncbi:MAG: tyrosine-type recombinase/integrase [Ktedonobacterales bacterium]
MLLTAFAIEALKRHRVRQNEERLALGSAWLAGYDLVFPDTDGGPKDNTILGREFVRLLKKAGLPRIRFHDLRHTVATLLFAQRVNPKVVSEMLGHSDIAITLGLYGHVTPPMQREATEMMNRIFDDTRQDDEGGAKKA